MKKFFKYLLIIGLPLVILLIVAKKQGWLGSEEGLQVETASVERHSIVESVIASGKIQPETEVKISPEVSGEIIALPVKEGQNVSKGDLLVKINPDLFIAAVNRTEAAVNQARAALASAKAQYQEAEKSFKRNKKLSEQKVISQAEFDAAQRAYQVAKLNVESAEYQLESAQASLKEARDNLTRTTIYAPQAGTVIMLNSEVGERVVGTAQMAGTEIMRIADLKNMEVLVEVNENDIIRVSHHDTAIIEVDAYLGEEFKGVVTEIANSANLQGQSVDQVTNFEVKVRILPSSYREKMEGDSVGPFRPGMTASVEILTERKEAVIAVPIQAVTTRADTSGERKLYENDEENEKDSYEVVFLVDGDKAQLRTVKTGIQDDELIEIETGLNGGETIVTGPYSAISRQLKNGSLIAISEEEQDREEKEE